MKIYPGTYSDNYGSYACSDALLIRVLPQLTNNPTLYSKS